MGTLAGPEPSYRADQTFRRGKRAKHMHGCEGHAGGRSAPPRKDSKDLISKAKRTRPQALPFQEQRATRMPLSAPRCWPDLAWAPHTPRAADPFRPCVGGGPLQLATACCGGASMRHARCPAPAPMHCCIDAARVWQLFASLFSSPTPRWWCWSPCPPPRCARWAPMPPARPAAAWSACGAGATARRWAARWRPSSGACICPFKVRGMVLP